jgi:hypothetical protein
MTHVATVALVEYPAVIFQAISIYNPEQEAKVEAEHNDAGS